MSFVIEKNIPIPSARLSGVTEALRNLAVGESFTTDRKKRSTLGQAFYRLTPKRFTTRAISEAEVRVWRIA